MLSSVARADNIDLSTVPTRDSIQLTIYNTEDLTLVRETRTLSFKKGANPLQFSWANTLIDPTSVELRFLTQPQRLELLDTTFPHDKPQMLTWNVQSQIDGEATVEITYFTSGIRWTADYVCIADPSESTLDVQSYVRVSNNSGEEYEDARVRLVVGKINLVEKIAQLARLPVSELAKNLEREPMTRFKFDALRGSVEKAAEMDRAAAKGERRQKEVVKEGLSEYFLYTVEGTETIPNGWSKRLRSFHAPKVPLAVRYRYRPAEYGDRLVRMYLLTNDKPSKLGTTPLPDGSVRVFRDNGHDGLSYLASQTIKYIPIGDRIELNLGQDPEVIFDLVKLRVQRDNLWMHLHGANVFRRVDDGAIQIDPRSTVAGWDDHTLYAQRVRNYTGKPIDVEVRRTYGGDIDFRSRLAARLHDYRTVEYTARVPAGEKVDLRYEILQRQGHNAKQQHVTLQAAEAN